MNMETLPLVSILVPVYNCGAYLPRCLDSILSQTHTNLQVVLVDDGSTDQSGAICDRYAASDSRVQVIHKANAGVAAARNTCLEAASGEYLMFVDSDDYLSHDAVQSLYEALCRDGSDLAIGRHTDVYDDGSENDSFCRWMTDRVYTNREILSMMGEPNRPAVTPWGKLYTKAAMCGIRYPGRACGEDLSVFPYILENCPRVSVVDRLIYFYYQRSGSILHVYNTRTQIDNLEANLHITRYFWENGYRSSAQRWYAHSIDRAYQYGDAAVCRTLFAAYLDKAANKALFKAQTPKTRLKWLVLQSPLLRKLALRLKK